MQFLQTTERRVRPRHRRRAAAAVDGRRLDEGTPSRTPHTIDVEDYAVLFALEAERAGRGQATPARPWLAGTRWSSTRRRSSRRWSSSSFAGRWQASRLRSSWPATPPSRWTPPPRFGGWDAVMAALGRPGSYPRGAGGELPLPARRDGAGPRGARGRVSARPRRPAFTSSTRRTKPSSAGRAHRAPRAASSSRTPPQPSPSSPAAPSSRAPGPSASATRCRCTWRSEGDFRFGPGVVATCVAEVKGLEFDVVILADTQGHAWTSTPEARRGLYVALTRATHWLALATLSKT